MIHRLLFVAFLLGLLSCNEGDPERKTDLLPTASLVYNQLTVICPAGGCDEDLKEALQFVFAQPIKGLYESEPEFDLIFVSDVQGSKLLSAQPNILQLKVNSKMVADQLRYQQDKWAKQQLFFLMEAADPLSLQTLILNRGSEIKTLIRANELERYKRAGTEDHFLPHDSSRMSLPEGFELVSSGDHFSYFGAFGQGLCKSGAQLNCNFQLGYLVFELGYKGPASFQDSMLLAIQDSITAQVILGPKRAYPTFFKTSPLFPLSTDTLPGKAFVVKQSGWWDMEGATMGGPYQLYAFYNPKTLRFNGILSFVFAPGLNKRDYLMTMQRSAEIFLESLYLN